MPSLIAILGLDGASFKRNLDEAVSQAAAGGKAIASELGGMASKTLAGLVTVGAMEELIRSTVEYGEHIVELSHRLGIGTDSVQVWDYALKRNGSTIDEATGFFEKMAISRDKALKGGAGQIQAFKELGVAIDDLKGKRIEDIAEQISDVFKSGDPQALIGALREIGGRNAGEMVDTLRDGLKESRDEAERLGLVINGDVLENLKQTGDRWTQFASQLRAGFAPLLSQMVEGLQVVYYLSKALLSSELDLLKALATGDAILHPLNTIKAIKGEWSKAYDDMIANDKALMAKASRDSEFKFHTDLDESPEESSAKRIAALQDRLAEKKRQASLVAMNDEQKLTEFITERAALEKQIAEDKDPEQALKDKIKEADLEEQIARLKKEETKARREKHGELNANQKAGAFAGSADDLGNMLRAAAYSRGLKVQDHQIDVLRAANLTNQKLDQMLTVLKGYKMHGGVLVPEAAHW